MDHEPVRLSGAPDALPVRPGVTLRRYRPDDVDALVAVINANVGHLRPWMPWAGEPATTQSITAFVHRAEEDFAAGANFVYGVFADDGELLGGCGLHARAGPGVLEIGYWIAERHTGRGLARAVARALTVCASAVPGVQRVEIRCDAANRRSAAIPEALGYRLLRVEQRPPAAPAETDRHLVWSLDAGAVPTPLVVTAATRPEHSHAES